MLSWQVERHILTAVIYLYSFSYKVLSFSTLFLSVFSKIIHFFSACCFFLALFSVSVFVGCIHFVYKFCPFSHFPISALIHRKRDAPFFMKPTGRRLKEFRSFCQTHDLSLCFHNPLSFRPSFILLSSVKSACPGKQVSMG